MTAHDDHKKHEPWIHTQFGRFYFDKPEFKPEAIAWALGNICRYNGHATCFYSVAEHCGLVASLMQELKLGDPFEGLMHDASEAYLRDIPAPWKQYMPDAVSIEDRIDRQIREAFKLPLEKTPGCDKADKLALFIEAYYLMPDKGEAFTDVLGVRPEAMALVKDKWKVHGWWDGDKAKSYSPPFAAHMWMMGYKFYGPKIEVVEGDVEVQAARAEAGNQSEGHALVVA